MTAMALRLVTPTATARYRPTVAQLLGSPERSAGALQARFGWAALLRLPAQDFVDGALLQLGAANTVPARNAQGSSSQALMMLRSFRDMELEFLSGPSGVMLMGRSPDAHVLLEEDSVSKLHACVRWDERGASVEDLRSRNGTTLGGLPVAAPSPLVDGDFLCLGGANLMFVTCATLFLQLESVRRCLSGVS